MYDIFNGGAGGTGKPEAVINRDKLLDEITLNWLTNTAASSARLYAEQARIMGGRNNPGRVDLPVGVSAFPQDMPVARSWAPLVYPKLFYWNEPNHGGHFVQLEDPLLFTDELRRCFHTLKSQEAS
jgi:pimeloyl-ACP methyl ester carboxylesterase